MEGNATFLLRGFIVGGHQSVSLLFVAEAGAIP